MKKLSLLDLLKLKQKDRIFYYGDKNEAQENAVKKSFPNINLYACVNDGRLNDLSFECDYAFDGRVIECKLQNNYLAVFSKIDTAKPFDGFGEYDMVVCGYLHERVFAILKPKIAVSYLRSSTYTDAESLGNLVFKFK